MDEDDEDAGAADRKRGRRESKLASKKLEKDESKKKARVLVEVYISNLSIPFVGTL